MFAGPSNSRTGRVTYLSAPTPFAVRVRPLINVTRQVIWRSFDGGVKWEVAGGFDIDSKNIPGLPSREYVSFGKGVVGPDGTVYIGGRYGRRFAVAVSRDEGLTWDVRMVPGSALAKYHNAVHFLLLGSRYLLPESMAVDDDGNVYAVWPDRDGLLHAAWSSDGAVNWSRPVVVSAPGVRDARFGAITATGSGRVGIAYYGREKGVPSTASSRSAATSVPAARCSSAVSTTNPMHRCFPTDSAVALRVSVWAVHSTR